jgi:hypothetical protein
MMKRGITIQPVKVAGLLLAMASPVFAQAPPSEADMQRMMQGMQEMQRCMAQIDKVGLERLEKRANQIESELDALCAGGKRDEAQKKAMAYGIEFADDPTLKTLLACTEKIQGMIPPMPFLGLSDEDANSHVCDG